MANQLHDNLANVTASSITNQSALGLEQMEKAEADLKSQEAKNKLWMDFDDFFVCFKYASTLKNSNFSYLI